MSKQTMRVLFLALCVTLLVVVSARVSPEDRNAFVPSERIEAELWPEVSYTPEPTPTPTPEPTVRIRTYLPDIVLTDWELRLVNNDNLLSRTFSPESVTPIRDYGQYFDTRAIDALEAMLTGAEEAGYTVWIKNGYRPYIVQANLFNGRATVISENEGVDLAEGERRARLQVAYPGTSEHQLGLCVDIVDAKDTSLDSEKCENLPVLLWLREHCAEYGFIYRYPKEKKELTGWYEPWHFRYVGVDAAKYIMENGLCLEEFYAQF